MAEHLAADGWRIVARNWHGGGGELDLVIERAGALRIVEVRARATDEVPVLETIGRGKQRRLRRAAEAWLQGWPNPFHEVAFLVAVVDLGVVPWTITLIDDAFDGG